MNCVISSNRGWLCVLLLGGLVPAAARADEPIAVVNGRPIPEKRFYRVLSDAHGVEILQQLIVLELAKDEAARRKIRVGRAEIEAEFERAVDRIAAEAGLSGPEATRENKLKALRTILQQRCVSMAEFRLSMERNAYLRKIVSQDLKISEATLREEFARTYGEKVRVRHIQIAASDRKRLNDVLTALASGDAFEDVARRYSQNPQTASRGGEMPPFSFDDDSIDPALREAAFMLKPGEVSPPIRAGQYFHILKLIERIKPEQARFDDVRDRIEQRVRERAIGKRMEQLAVKLFNEARIRILDRNLERRYKDFLEQQSLKTTP